MKKLILVLCLVFSCWCHANLDYRFPVKAIEITVEEKGIPVVVVAKTDGMRLTELALTWRNRMLVVPLDEFSGIRHPFLHSVSISGFSNSDLDNHADRECDYTMIVNIEHGPSEDAWREIIEQTAFFFCPTEYKKRTRTQRVSAKKQNNYLKLVGEKEVLFGATINVTPSKSKVSKKDDTN